ncbi:MAG: acetylxylan esterase [Planctomycetota bacterium]
MNRSTHAPFHFQLFFFISLTLLNMGAAMPIANAQNETIYDEAKIPAYSLPDPLVADDGTKIDTPSSWQEKRRPEILKHFKEHVFGTMPNITGQHAVQWTAKTTSDSNVTLPVDFENPTETTVKANVREVTITLLPKPSLNANPEKQAAPAEPLDLHLVIFSPANTDAPLPAFLAYNFKGNHTLTELDEVALLPVWDSRQKRLVDAQPNQRGERQSRWQVGSIINRGYALVCLNYGDVDPDFHDDFKNGAHRFFPSLQNRNDNWTSIGAWAWGLHRILDYLEKDASIDAQKTIVFGHSRLGKTALWAGATDTRIAAVISNNSGCGGAALSRRRFGESVKRINTTFPHWFCKKHRDYNDNEDASPVDHHQLIALIAPRPVYVASAEDDRWADPKGEYLSLFYADPVFRLFGKSGVASVSNGQPKMPQLESPIGSDVRYHIRRGKHNVTRYDWDQFLDFADHVFGNQK